MPVLQNLYQVYKISSSKIVQNNLNIDSYTKKQAALDGALVSIGDNMLFHKIRDYYGDKREHTEIFEDIIKLRKTLKICKKQKKFNEAAVVNQQINNILFVKDVVVVTCEKKKDYQMVGLNDFYLNGTCYTRFCAGAGNLRRNCAIYVNKELYSYLYECFMCGLADKISEAVLSKIGAYFALCFSSVLWVRTPRCCVIHDFENVIYNQKVDYICHDMNDKHYIEERNMDIVLNCADGQGLVDPIFAALWSEDMHLDYIPSSFVVRSSFVKGNLVPFDFKEYARENGITEIIDKWGVKYNIEDIDVILSESQFKEHKEYQNWQEYLYYFEKYNLRWGVSRYNKKHDDEYVLANYQYIQSLDITREDIEKLIEPTIDWFKKICSGDTLYTLLFMIGCKNSDIDFSKLESVAQSTVIKAVIKNKNMLNDGYIQQKIYKNIVEYINRAKIGKIWVRGNYQFMISDPIAQCRFALGLKPDGEIPANHIYSNFWRERGISGIIDVCRSPQIDTHEHNPSILYESYEANRWYQYIHSGIILSIYDTATLRLSDADFDGDLVMTTDNEYFIKGSHKDQNVITYEKGIAKKEKISKKNFVKKDMMGFGTAVGSFSNTATILYSMIGIFTKPEQEEQRKELYRRIKLLREYVGQEIDRAKLGIKKPKLPKEWREFESISEDDSDEEKSAKYYHNSLVISKKPYFFRYLYPELNERFKKYENDYNIICKDMFGIKLKKLLAKKEKTPAESTIIKRYQKFSPLIVSNCTMNILCKCFENMDLDIKFNKNKPCMLPKFDWLYDIEEFKFNEIKNLYKKYNNKKSIKLISSIFTDNKNEEEITEIKFAEMDFIRDEIRENIYNIVSCDEEFLFYCWKISTEYKSFNWKFAWDVLGESILDCIEEGDCMVPVRDKDGTEYLGSNYSLEKVKKVDINV